MMDGSPVGEPAAPKRLGRTSCAQPSIVTAREYARAVAVAWWEGCLATRGHAVIPIAAADAAGPSACLKPEAASRARAMGTSLGTLPPREAAARLGQIYCSMLPTEHRGANGIFYTPPALADLLLDRAEEAGHDWSVGKVIDPSCGAGALLSGAACRIAAALEGQDPASVVAAVSDRLAGWDIDPFAAWLARVSVEVALLPHVLASGTRLGRLTSARDSLAGWAGHAGEYALVMGNPPFARIKDAPAIRARFRRSLYGHPNVYTMFTDLAVHLATAEDGIVAYLTPAGYLGGRYSTKLRQLLSTEAPPVSIDVVGSRRGVFEGVLQEVALSVFRRGGRRGPAMCAATLVGKGRARSEPTGDLELPVDQGAPWLVPRDARDASMVRRMHSMPSRLVDWGYEVATGPLVWNRNKARLHRNAREGSVPIVWAGSVGMDGEARPGSGRQHGPTHYGPVGSADPNLVRGPCLLICRTTSKEQRRRLVSAILPQSVFDLHGAVCVENHLNMIGQIGAAIITPAFMVAFVLARLFYGAAEAAIHLGMTMGLREMMVALVASLVMTVVSSLFAIRRLWKVDPIMLFE